MRHAAPKLNCTPRALNTTLSPGSVSISLLVSTTYRSILPQWHRTLLCLHYQCRYHSVSIDYVSIDSMRVISITAMPPLQCRSLLVSITSIDSATVTSNTALLSLSVSISFCSIDNISIDSTSDIEHCSAAIISVDHSVSIDNISIDSTSDIEHCSASIISVDITVLVSITYWWWCWKDERVPWISVSNSILALLVAREDLVRLCCKKF
jgi:hypothetical protein